MIGRGHLHPLKYALGLAAACEQMGVKIYEKSPVTSWDKTGLMTAKGRVEADTLIFAGNALLAGLVPAIRPLSNACGHLYDRHRAYGRRTCGRDTAQ